jgi:hypothetical protein
MVKEGEIKLIINRDFEDDSPIFWGQLQIEGEIYRVQLWNIDNDNYKGTVTNAKEKKIKNIFDKSH